MLIPFLGALYAYQFTGQAREEIVPFKPFKPSLWRVYEVGDPQALAEQGRGLELPVKAPVTLVNFWATWCPPCVEEFPAMLELQRRLEGQLDIVFVSIDERSEDVEAFFVKHGLEVKAGRLFWDPKRALATAWGSEKFPESYVLRRDGWVVERIVGLQQWTRPAVIQYFEELASRWGELPAFQPAQSELDADQGKQ